MRGILYLISHLLKNRLKQLKKKPALLICYLIMIASLAFLLFGQGKGGLSNNRAAKDISYLYLILTGIGLIYIYSFVQIGLTRGGTLFSMSDVTFLFVSPISPRKILVYGLIRQMGLLILSCIFILFQIPNLVIQFHFSGAEIIVLFVEFFMMLFFMQLVSIWLFLISHGNAARKKRIQTIYYAVVTVLAGYILYHYLVLKESILLAAVSLMKAKWFSYVPVLGWNVTMLNGSYHKDAFCVFWPFLVYVLVMIGIISYFTKHETNFYECVLVSTEETGKITQAAKEGRTVRKPDKKIVVKSSGIGAGSGASAIFYRQLTEEKRAHGKLWFLRPSTIVLAVAAGIFMNSVKETYAVCILLGILIYLELIFMVAGMFDGDLKKYYIYLIPAPSMKKLFYSTSLPLVNKSIQSILVFTAAGIAGKLSFVLTVSLMFAYFNACAIWNLIPVLIRFIFKEEPAPVLNALLRMVLGFLCMIPGVVAAVLCGILVSGKIAAAVFLTFGLTSILVVSLLYFLCRNIFSKAS